MPKIRNKKRNRIYYHSYNQLISKFNLDADKPSIDWEGTLKKHKKTEGYLRCHLYHKLKLKGINSIPEFTDRPNKSRYDLLIVHNEKPLCIVEVKKSRAAVDMEQLERYERNSFGIPVLSLAGYELFDEVYFNVLRFASLHK